MPAGQQNSGSVFCGVMRQAYHFSAVTEFGSFAAGHDLIFYPHAHAAHTYSLDFVDSEWLLILIRLVGNVSIYNYSRFSC